MANVLDARAWIYCNLGKVISGNIQESSVIGAGLVNISGTLQLSGVYRVRRGDPVELSYYKNGRVARLGRKLRVISAYANPVTRTTEVAIGCYLTYQAESSPRPQMLSSADDANTPSVERLAALLLVKPISAKFIAEKCCDALGLNHDTIPLTNQFYRDKFEISGPYLNVLSDLLLSENYVGYVDSTETLKFINLASLNGTGPVLDESRIIDIAPINSGDPEPDVAYSVVRRISVKLDNSLDAEGSGEAEDIEDILARNDIPITPKVLAFAEGSGDDDDEDSRTTGYIPSYWLSGRNTETSQTQVFRYQPPKVAGETSQPAAITATVTYNPSSSWDAQYSGSGRIKYRKEVKGGVWGNTVTETYYENSENDGVETVIETTSVMAPKQEIVVACGFPPEVVPNLPGDISAVASGLSLREKIRTVTRATDTSVITVEYRTVPMIYTAEGAANIQKYIESYTKRYKSTELAGQLLTGPVIEYASRIVSLPASVKFAQKARGVKVAQTLPAPESEDDSGSNLPPAIVDPPSTAPTDSLDAIKDPKAGYSVYVTETPEIVYSKNTPGGIVLEFTPPYFSDDRLVAVGSKYSVIPSDAAAKAKLFAGTQSRLRFGKKNGQSVVFPVEYVPTTPFGPVYLDFGGVVGQYRMDSTNIVFDSTGILVSTDAIFWGGVGQ